jgi:hypothetical protein
MKHVLARFKGTATANFAAACSGCSRPIRRDAKAGLCIFCRAVCPTCKKEKDPRAVECDSCGKSRKAKVQWQAKRPTMLAGISKASITRRTRFEELTSDSFYRVKQEDGRLFAIYWDDQERRRYLYRYRWVWILANGPISSGMEIHHINGDCTDDRLENLQMISNHEHRKLHGQMAKMAADQHRRSTT